MNNNCYLIALVIILQGTELHGWFENFDRPNPNFNDWNGMFFPKIKKGSKEKYGKPIPASKCSSPHSPPSPPPLHPPPKPQSSCLFPTTTNQPGPSIPRSPPTTLTCDTTPSGRKSGEKSGKSQEKGRKSGEQTEDNDENAEDLLTIIIPNYALPSNISTYLQSCDGMWQWNQYVTSTMIEQWAQQFFSYYSYSVEFWDFVITNFPGIFAYSSTYNPVQLTLPISSSVIDELKQNLPSWGIYINGMWVWPAVLSPAIVPSVGTTPPAPVLTTITFTIPNQVIQAAQQNGIDSYVQNINGQFKWSKTFNVDDWASALSELSGYPIDFWIYVLTNNPQLFSDDSSSDSSPITFEVPYAVFSTDPSSLNATSLQQKYGNSEQFWNFFLSIYQYLKVTNPSNDAFDLPLHITTPTLPPTSSLSVPTLMPTVPIPTTAITLNIPSEIIQALQDSQLAQSLQNNDGSYQWPQNINTTYWANYFTNDFGFSEQIWSYIITNFPQTFSKNSNSNSITVQVPSSAFDLINSSKNMSPSQLVTLLIEKYGQEYNANFWNFVTSANQYLQNGQIVYPFTTLSLTIPSQVIQIIQKSGLGSHLSKNNNSSYSWNSDFDSNYWAQTLSNETNYPVQLWIFLFNNYPSIFASDSTISSVTITIQIPYWVLNIIQTSNLKPTELASQLQSQNGNTIDFWNFLISIKSYLQTENQNSGIIDLPSLPPLTPPPATPSPMTNITFTIPSQVIQYIQQSDISSYLDNSDGSLKWNSNFNLSDWAKILATQTGYPSDFWAFILTNYPSLFQSSNINSATLSFTVPYSAINYILTNENSTDNAQLINSLQSMYGQSNAFWSSLISVDTYLVVQNIFIGYINLPNPLTTTSTTKVTTTTTTPPPTGGFSYGLSLNGVPCSIVQYVENSNLTSYLSNSIPEGGTPYYQWNGALNFPAWTTQLATDVGNATNWQDPFLRLFPTLINNIIAKKDINTPLTPAEINSIFSLDGCN